MTEEEFQAIIQSGCDSYSKFDSIIEESKKKIAQLRKQIENL